MKQSHKTIFLWALLIILFVSFYHLFSQPAQEVVEIDFTAFMSEVHSGSVKDVTMKGTDYRGTFTDGEEFKTIGPWPVDAELRKALLEEDVVFRFENPEQSSLLLSVFFQWLPLLFIIVLFVFLMRHLQGGGGKAMNFGKSKARLLAENTIKVTFDDVSGIEEAKDELEEIVSFLKDPKRFTRLGGRIPKGVLMMGAPGTGKTLLARAIAGEAGVPFFSISGSDFVEMFVGVGASRVRDLFEQGKKNAPCIVFIDEIDAVGRHRGAGLGGGHDEREQTLNQLLVEMDGFEANDGVILIAATNRPDVLDPALLRPGRFDRRIVVPPPDLRGRVGILKVHTRKVPIGDTVDLEVVARGTPGFSGADLENLVNEAALFAARQGRELVETKDLEWAKDKVMMGTERRSMVISDTEKKTTAVHEAGHAVVARLLPGADPVHKVSIIPRGRALGITMQLPIEDRHNITREYALNMITVMMGGRIAESMILDQLTTGASDDIERATDLARKMVTEWGMSEKLGPLSFGTPDGEVFLGREMTRSATYSEHTALEIDGEIGRIVRERYEFAEKLLDENRDKLLRVADALIEHETLSGKEIDAIMAGEDISEDGGEDGGKEGEDRKKSKLLGTLVGGLAGGSSKSRGKAIPEPEKA